MGINEEVWLSHSCYDGNLYSWNRKEGVISCTWRQGWGQERLKEGGNTQADSSYGVKFGDTEKRAKGLPDRGETNWGDKKRPRDQKVDEAK